MEYGKASINSCLTTIVASLAQMVMYSVTSQYSSRKTSVVQALEFCCTVKVGLRITLWAQQYVLKQA